MATSASKAALAAKSTREVYRGYMPIDLPQHRKRNPFKPWWPIIGKPRYDLYPKQAVEGYSEKPEYPELNDGSHAGIKRQFRVDWYDSLKKLPTSEQKLYEIANKAAHRIIHFNNYLHSYNSLPVIKSLTQTVLIDTLPDSYSIVKSPEATASADHNLLVERVRKLVLDQIALDKYESLKSTNHFVSKSVTDGIKSPHMSNKFVQNIVSSVKRLAHEINPQLLDYQSDLSPAIRSWWWHSNFPPAKDNIFYKARKDEDGNVNAIIQMIGATALNLRSDSMLEPVLSQDDPLVTDLSLVNHPGYPLTNFGATYKFKRPVTLPGFWFEDEPKYDQPHTCFLSTDCLEARANRSHKVVKPLTDREDCLNGQAILTAFGWANSLSMYHGYTPYQEIDYPFTCQVVTTDGQNWLFNIYQLNCHSFHRDLGRASKNNICWSSGMLELYENYSDGTFNGVNDNVIELLLKFLSKKTIPEYTQSLNLRPHLGEDTRTEEEKTRMAASLKNMFENKKNSYYAAQWRVPIWEHIFFRSPMGRDRIKFMKKPWHVPAPKYPKEFE